MLTKTEIYLLILHFHLIYGEDIFNKNLGVVLEQTEGIINTGYRELQVHLLDTFNHKVNDNHKKCEYSNTTRVVEAKEIFRRMVDEQFTLHGYEVRHAGAGNNTAQLTTPTTTTKTTKTTKTTTAKTTMKTIVTNNTRQAYQIEDYDYKRFEPISNFNPSNSNLVPNEFLKNITKITDLEAEINKYTRNESDITQIECQENCHFVVKNLEMFKILTRFEGEKHIRIHFILPLPQKADERIEVFPYQRNWTEAGQLINGVQFRNHLILIALTAENKGRDFTITTEIEETDFLVIKMESVVQSESITGSIAWTKNYAVDQIDLSFEWQNLNYGYMDVNEYEDYQYEQYSENLEGFKRKRRNTKVRKKRNLFNIAYLDDVDEKISTAMKLATQIQFKKINNLTNDAVSKLADLIKANGIAIEQQGNTISNLIGTMCKMKNSIQTQFIEQNLKIHFIQIINHLLEIMHDCRKGNFPQSLINVLLEKLCHLHMHKSKCIWAKPILREFISCSLGTVWIGSNHVMIDLKLSVPQNLQESYRLFRPYTVPVFYNESATEIKGLANSLILEWSHPPEYQILKKCKDYKNHYICDTVPNTNPGLLDCVNGITRNSPKDCPLDSFKPQSSCYVVKTNHGLLVSTKTPLAIHKEDRKRIFQSKTTKIKGTEFIPNKKNIIQSINCNDMVVMTTRTEEIQRKIVHNTSFDWDVNWDGTVSRLNMIEKTFENRQEFIKNYIKNLNNTVGEIKEEMKPDHQFIEQLIPEKEKPKKLLLGVTITLVSILILGAGVLIIYCRYCKKSRYSPGKIERQMEKRIRDSESERIKRVSRNQRIPYGYPIVTSEINNHEMERLALPKPQTTYI